MRQKSSNSVKETKRRNPREDKGDDSNKRSLKPASWYRVSNVETTEAASDPGKVTNRRASSNDGHPLKVAAQGKKLFSVCSQVMADPTDGEEVISPVKRFDDC